MVLYNKIPCRVNALFDLFLHNSIVFELERRYSCGALEASAEIVNAAVSEHVRDLSDPQKSRHQKSACFFGSDPVPVFKCRHSFDLPEKRSESGFAESAKLGGEGQIQIPVEIFLDVTNSRNNLLFRRGDLAEP